MTDQKIPDLNDILTKQPYRTLVVVGHERDEPNGDDVALDDVGAVTLDQEELLMMA